MARNKEQVTRQDRMTDQEHQSAGTSQTDTGSRDAFTSMEYAGFWVRLLACVLDTVLLLMVAVPLELMFYGPQVLFATESPGLAYDVINYGLPVFSVMVFWRYRAATPGKIMMDIYIVDADTLRQPTFGRLILRYLGYYVSIFTLFLGFFWIGWDKRKQGFHDKIAKTVVIKKSSAVNTSGHYGQKQLGEQGSYASGNKDSDPVEPAPKDPWQE